MPEMGTRLAVFGGVYSNHLALEAVLEDLARRGADRAYCLGDLGGFGPHPDRAAARLIESGVPTLRGNYDDSIGHERADCACGYTDPRDNHFAQLSYDYTLARAPGLDAGPPRAAATRGRGPPAAALPRLAAPGQRVPVGVGVLGRVPRV